MASGGGKTVNECVIGAARFGTALRPLGIVTTEELDKLEFV